MPSTKTGHYCSSSSYAALVLALLAGRVLFQVKDTPSLDVDAQSLALPSATLPDASMGCTLQRVSSQLVEDTGSSNVIVALQTTESAPTGAAHELLALAEYPHKETTQSKLPRLHSTRVTDEAAMIAIITFLFLGLLVTLADVQEMSKEHEDEEQREEQHEEDDKDKKKKEIQKEGEEYATKTVQIGLPMAQETYNQCFILLQRFFLFASLLISVVRVFTVRQVSESQGGILLQGIPEAAAQKELEGISSRPFLRQPFIGDLPIAFVLVLFAAVGVIAMQNDIRSFAEKDEEKEEQQGEKEAEKLNSQFEASTQTVFTASTCPLAWAKLKFWAFAMVAGSLCFFSMVCAAGLDDVFPLLRKAPMHSWKRSGMSSYTPDWLVLMLMLSFISFGIVCSVFDVSIFEQHMETVENKDGSRAVSEQQAEDDEEEESEEEAKGSNSYFETCPLCLFPASRYLVARTKSTLFALALVAVALCLFGMVCTAVFHDIVPLLRPAQTTTPSWKRSQMASHTPDWLVLMLMLSFISFGIVSAVVDVNIFVLDMGTAEGRERSHAYCERQGETEEEDDEEEEYR